MRPRLAIDPGKDGGLAWHDRDGIVYAIPMPKGMTAQVDEIRTIAAANPGITALLEQVGTHRPGNSAVASTTFSRHCGNLESALYCLGIPAIQKTPQTWQKALGTWPADKQERKRAIKESMARRYPAILVTLKTADALGMLTWFVNSETQGQQAGEGKE